MKIVYAFLIFIVQLVPAQNLFAQVKNFVEFENFLRNSFDSSQDRSVFITITNKSAIAESIVDENIICIIKKDTCYLKFLNNDSSEVFYIDGYGYYYSGNGKYKFHKKIKSNGVKERLSFLPLYSLDNFIEKYGYARNYFFGNSGDSVISFSLNDEKLIFHLSGGLIWKYSQTITSKQYGVQYKEYIFKNIPFKPVDIKSRIDLLDINAKQYNSKAKKQNGRTNIDIQKLTAILGCDCSASTDLIVLDFFFQSCLPCLKSIPLLNEKFEESKGNSTKIFGVDPFLTDSATMPKYIDRYNVKYPIISGIKAIQIKELIFKDNHFPYPTMIGISCDGKIAFYQEGLNEKRVKKFLAIDN